MDALQAAVLRRKLTRLDGWNEDRRRLGVGAARGTGRAAGAEPAGASSPTSAPVRGRRPRLPPVRRAQRATRRAARAPHRHGASPRRSTIPTRSTSPTPTRRSASAAGSLPVSERLAAADLLAAAVPGNERRRARAGRGGGARASRKSRAPRPLMGRMDDLVTTSRASRRPSRRSAGDVPSRRRGDARMAGARVVHNGWTHTDVRQGTHARAPAGPDRRRDRRLRLLGPEPRTQPRRAAGVRAAGAVRPRPRPAALARAPPPRRERPTATSTHMLGDASDRGRRHHDAAGDPPPARNAGAAGRQARARREAARDPPRPTAASWPRCARVRRPGADAGTHLHLQPRRQHRARPDPSAASSATSTSSPPRA